MFAAPMNAELCNQAEELIGNPNVLVNIISARVRQLNTGGARPLIDSPLLGAADLALTELIEGKMEYELTDPVANEILTAKTAVKGKKKKKESK
jgi:DNA-directed RNA polymerase subunit omega|tara:strand:+ start:1592 stop:1873 length:282 start_codon:yes stop_codon:yes gene_type:complete